MRRDFVAVFFAALLAAPRLAYACTCVDVGPACQAFWKADAVFDATVIALADVPRAEASPGSSPFPEDRRVTLDVRQGWKGVAPGSLDVFTSGSSASCGYDFKPGHRYLVFARRGPADGRWSVSLCSATREYNGSG